MYLLPRAIENKNEENSSCVYLLTAIIFKNYNFLLYLRLTSQKQPSKNETESYTCMIFVNSKNKYLFSIPYTNGSMQM